MPLNNPPINPTEKNKKKAKKSSPEKEIKETADLEKKQDKVDSREEFFKLMANKIDGAKTKEGIETEEDEVEEGDDSGVKFKSSSRAYKKMFLRFSFLAILLFIVIAYFSFLKLHVIVKSEKNLIDSNLSFYAYSNGGQANIDRAISANISKIELEKKGTFQATGEENLGGEIIGKVTIKNEYSKNQPLVAKTRLLSSDDKLFRLKDTVNVPAGSSIEVDIYADEVSEEMAIAPDKFIIPGLWVGLQDKIYAESFESFKYEKSSKKFVSANDIENAKESLSQEMIEEAEKKAQAVSTNGRQYVIDLNQETSVINKDKSVGDEAQNFEMSIKNLVTIISFETDDIVDLAKQRLDLETNQAPAEILVDSLEYELVNFNSAKNMAELKLNFSARASSVSDEVINKKHLTNLNKKQIEAYLDKIEEIDSYELKFSPDFIKVSPLLVSKIFVEYK
jgi:hypothetical protein